MVYVQMDTHVTHIWVKIKIDFLIMVSKKNVDIEHIL